MLWIFNALIPNNHINGSFWVDKTGCRLFCEGVVAVPKMRFRKRDQRRRRCKREEEEPNYFREKTGWTSEESRFLRILIKKVPCTVSGPKVRAAQQGRPKVGTYPGHHVDSPWLETRSNISSCSIFVLVMRGSEWWNRSRLGTQDEEGMGK